MKGALEKSRSESKSTNLSLHFFVLSVPMDLDAKIKGVILGSCFLIVSNNRGVILLKLSSYKVDCQILPRLRVGKEGYHQGIWKIENQFVFIANYINSTNKFVTASF